MDVLKKLNYILDSKTKLKSLVMVLVVLIGAIMELVGVSVVLPVINLAVQPDEIYGNSYCKAIMRITGMRETKSIMITLIVLMAVVYIIKAVYLVWMNNAIFTFSKGVQTKISVRLMKAYISRPYPYFLVKNSSEIIRGIAADTSQFQNALSNCLLIASNTCMCVLLFAYLLKTNLLMTLLVGGLSVGSILINYLIFRKRLQTFGKDSQKLNTKNYKILFESFHGVKETKVMHRENYFISKFAAVNKQQLKLGKKSNFLQIMPRYVLECVTICGILLYLALAVLLYGGYASMIGQLSVFAVAAFKLLPAINAIYTYIGSLLTQKASLDLVYEDIKECESEKQTDYRYLCDSDIKPMSFYREIRLSDVAFHYADSEQMVLQNVNMTIEKGKSIGIVGVSGGGKTTLIDIILGLFNPQNGAVLVDGVDIRTNYGGWLNLVGYIPQDIYLSDVSIRENIAYGLMPEEIDDDRIEESLREAQLYDFVQTLPHGVNTTVGEAGSRLSGGQRQRIGIARALYNNPDILLLDEATSALDNSTEAAVMEAVEHLHGEKTLIIIAHRLSTVEKCDKVYEIKDGVAVERQ